MAASTGCVCAKQPRMDDRRRRLATAGAAPDLSNDLHIAWRLFVGRRGALGGPAPQGNAIYNTPGLLPRGWTPEAGCGAASRRMCGSGKAIDSLAVVNVSSVTA